MHDVHVLVPGAVVCAVGGLSEGLSASPPPSLAWRRGVFSSPDRAAELRASMRSAGAGSKLPLDCFMF